MALFTLCGSGSSCGNGADSKCITTLFCVPVAAAKQQWQNILHYFATATAAQYEHCGRKDVAAAAPCEQTLTEANQQGVLL